MIHILCHPEVFSLDTPIAHVIHSDPDFITDGDACLELGRGYLDNLFWWQVELSEEIKALSMKNTIIRRFKEQKNLYLSIFWRFWSK